MIPCPNCSHQFSTVADTRPHAGSQIRRRRKCERCENKFTTIECVEGTILTDVQIGASLVQLDAAKETVERVMQTLKRVEG